MRAQAELAPGQMLVSRAGAVWRWDGYTVRAGTPTEAAVRLQQRNRLAGLRARAAPSRRRSARGRRARAGAADGAEREAAAAEQRARAARREAEQRCERRARGGRRRSTAQAEQARARLAELDARLAALLPERDEAEAALADGAAASGMRAPDLTLLRAEVERARPALAAARDRDREAQRALEALEREAAARHGAARHHRARA